MEDNTAVVDGGFPGGRAKLPRLGTESPLVGRARSVSFVGTAFVRTATTPPEPPDAAPTGPEGGFEGYFTYESLFADADPAGPDSGSTVEAGPAVDTGAYETLGLTPDASWAEVVAAYRRLVKVHHPDRHATRSPARRDAHAERFRVVSAAFGRLEAVHRVREPSPPAG